LGRTVAQVMSEKNKEGTKKDEEITRAKTPNPQIVLSSQVRLRTVNFLMQSSRIKGKKGGKIVRVR
jgi:hypothetical protein